MRPPRPRPSCAVSKKVRCIFEKMKIVEDHDIENTTPHNHNIHPQPTHQPTYQHSTQSNSRRRGIMYVDDNDIFITSDRNNQLDDIRNKAQQAITFWKEALHVTGGVVRPSKCSWVMIDFRWNGAKCQYKRIYELSGVIHLDDEDGNRIPLKRNEPTTSLEGLGVYLQPAGSDDDQHKYFSDKITQWLGQVQLSSLPAFLNFNTLHSRILCTIHYPLATTCFSQEQCHRLKCSYIVKHCLVV